MDRAEMPPVPSTSWVANGYGRFGHCHLPRRCDRVASRCWTHRAWKCAYVDLNGLRFKLVRRSDGALQIQHAIINKNPVAAAALHFHNVDKRLLALLVVKERNHTVLQIAVWVECCLADHTLVIGRWHRSKDLRWVC